MARSYLLRSSMRGPFVLSVSRYGPGYVYEKVQVLVLSEEGEVIREIQSQRFGS